MQRWIGDLFRYFGASGIALAADGAVLYLALRVFHTHYLVAGAVGFSAGVVVAYLACIFWAFEARIFRDWKIELLIFACIGVAGLGITQVVLYVSVSAFEASILFAKIASTSCTFMFNFLFRRHFLFSSTADNIDIFAPATARATH